MSRELLLESSAIFNDATLFDKIRQSCIDINEKTDQESVQELVNEAIEYLEKDITKNIANELFSLLQKCFSYFPDLLLPMLNTLLEKSRVNSYFIIATATVLSYLIHQKPDLKLPDYKSFVNDGINEIRPQIPNSEISIFGHKIHPQFKYNLIINFLLCTDITMDVISDFLPYIFNSEKISNMKSMSTFIKALSERNLLSSLPDSILNNKDVLTKANNEILAYFIPFISDQIFIQIQYRLKSILKVSSTPSPLYCLNFINKCIKLNIRLDTSLVIKILFLLKSSEITPQICEYMNQYRFYVSPTKSKEFMESPCSLLLFDKLSSISFYTDEQLTQILKQKTNVEIKNLNDLSSSQFYIDIYSFFSENDYTKKLIEVIRYFIRKYVGKEKFIQIFDEMIFSAYPPTVKGTYFINMLLQKIGREYRELFQSKEHMTEFLSKVLEKKVTPIIEFSNIIDYETKLEMIQQPGQNQNPLLIYLCCYSPPKGLPLTITEITVLPQTSQSIEKCIDKEDKTRLNDEGLSFVSCALLLVKSKNKINVKGLTKEVILPFYSLASNYFEMRPDKKDDEFLDTISSPELISLLIEGFKLVSNNQSQTVINCVDKLLNSFASIFSEKLREEIVSILAPILLNGEYFADKPTLLIAILNNHKSIQVDTIIEYMFSHCSEIDFMPLQHSISKLEFNQEKASQLAFNCIRNPSLSGKELTNIIFLINSIFNFKLALNSESAQNLIKIYNEVTNESLFTESIIISEFMIKNGMTKEVHANVNTHPHSSSILPMIPYDELNDDELISVFVSDKKPETSNSLAEAVFNRMVKEKPNRIGYLISFFEKLKRNNKIGPKALLQAYNDKYVKYKDDIFEALDHIFELHPTHNIFLIRAEFKPYEIPDLEINQKVVSQLFKLIKERPNDYRPFYFLKIIASSFPFIFSSNIQECIDCVLPKLDDFHILFADKPENETKEQEKERINKFKTSFSAFSFLYSAMNATKNIDYVTLWYIKHYKELTKSQMFCFNIIFSVLISSYPLPMTMLLYKHNFVEMFTYFMQAEEDDKEYSILFSNNFNYSYYTMIKIFYNNVYDNMQKIALLSNEFDGIENLFDFFLEKHMSCILTQDIITANPGIFSLPDDVKIRNEEMVNFIIDVEDKKPYYLIESSYKERDGFTISDQMVNSFVDNYKRVIPLAVPDESPLPDVSVENSDQLMTYILMKPRWLQEFIFNQTTFPTLSDHRKMLMDTFNGMTQLPKSRSPPLDLHEFSRNHLYNKDFLKVVIEKSKSIMNQPIEYLYELMQYMSLSSTNVDGFTSIIATQLDEYTNSEDYRSANSISKTILLLNALLNITKKRINSVPNLIMLGNYIFYFFQVIGNKLIDLCLQPEYRESKQFMILIYQLLKMFPVKLPNRATQLIGFMFLFQDESMTIDAINFCSKFRVKELDHMEIIQNVFDQELENEKPKFDIINAFLKSFPSVGSARVLEMFNILESFMSKYQLNLKAIQDQESKNKDDDDEFVNMDGFDLQGNLSYIILNVEISDKSLAKFFGCPETYENADLEENIISLLDFIAPERDLNNSFTMSDSTFISQQQEQQQNQNYKFYPIPQYIYDTLPQFWQFFDKNRQIIDFILLKKFQKNKIPDPYDLMQQLRPRTPLFSSRLVTMYPECFSFEFRSVYFRQKMLQRIKSDLMIRLNIDPENIFYSSFRQLITLNRDKWLYLFNVKYTDNDGQDAGGLTKDWLTKLSQSIFNPKSELFECLEGNENYIIKQLPYEPSDDLLLAYKFAGMIVARALIQGELINAHLTRSLLKLILKHNVSPKDVEDADEYLFKSLKEIEENKIDDNPDYDLYFEVTTVGGQTFELIPNGSTIKVTDANKGDYIRLMAEYRLKKSVEKQVIQFVDGFETLIPHQDIRIFTPNELCLLICGVADIDVEDLKRNVRFNPPYNMETPVVKMFFEVISEWDKQNLTKLLMFITGSSRMPNSGFKFFVDIKKPITIGPDPDTSHFPVAHTCLNRIDLPQYADKQELSKKLLISISEDSFNLK